MSLRVTRQYVDVLGSHSDGKVRVTRQYVDVLGSHSDGKVRVTRQYVDVLSLIPEPVSAIELQVIELSI